MRHVKAAVIVAVVTLALAAALAAASAAHAGVSWRHHHPPSPSPTPTPSASPPVSPGLEPSWGGTPALTFDDEFNGTGLNSSVWETGFNCGLGNSCVSPPVNPAYETACYSTAMVTEPGDGYLHLGLVNSPSTCGGKTEPYTGSYVDSKLVFAQASGSFEARVYVPYDAAGQAYVWPAWWISNASTGDEIDIFEGLHGYVYGHSHPGGASGYACPTTQDVGWHDYGVAVGGGLVTFYYDGTQVCQVPYTGTSALHLIFDNTYGPQEGGPLPGSWPDTMLADWVRAWS